MKKAAFLFSVVCVLLFAVSCNHPSSADFAVSTNATSAILSSVVTCDGSSISFAVPSWPVSAARDAASDANEDRYFEITLYATSIDGFTPQTKQAHPGETITFSGLAGGSYWLSCFAWDENAPDAYSGRTGSIQVTPGSTSQAEIDLMLAGKEHILVRPTTTGVLITLKSINPEEAEYVSVFDAASSSSLMNPDFCFEFLNDNLTELFAGGGWYSFEWPFAPMNGADGTARTSYDFMLQYQTANGPVNETVSCCHIGDQYVVNLSDYKNAGMDYGEPEIHEGLKSFRRTVRLTDFNYSSFMDVFTDAIPENRLTNVGAAFETWAGDYVNRGNGAISCVSYRKVTLRDTDEHVDITNLETLGQGSKTDQFFMLLLHGDEVDLLDSNLMGNWENPYAVNNALSENGIITPTLRPFFSITDVPFGVFYLPPIKSKHTYTPITEKMSDGNVSMAIVEGIEAPYYAFTIQMPSNVVFMSLRNDRQGNSFEFTSKDSEGYLNAEGTVTIPWALPVDSDVFIPFILTYTTKDGNNYNGNEKVLCKYTGAVGNTPAITNREFSYENTFDPWGSPSSDEILISSSQFTVAMPEGKEIADYKIDPFFYRIPDDLGGNTIVYSLMLEKADGSIDQYDMRFGLTGDPLPEETQALFSETGFDVAGASNIYWCNNDEQGGVMNYFDTYWGEGEDQRQSGFYTQFLSSGPRLSTKGALAFRLINDDNKYIDTLVTDAWWGEYRIPLWNREFVYTGGAYPVQIAQEEH